MIHGPAATPSVPATSEVPPDDGLPRRLRQAVADPRFVFAGLALVGLIETVWAAPTLAAEANRDWFVYSGAGQHLVAGLSPYVPVVAGPFVYPPPMALLWSGSMTEATWMFLKVAALATLVPLLGWSMALPVLALSALQVPLQFDFLIGNVTAFYVAAAVWFRRRPGWSGAVPLGLLLALAVKPAYLPLLIVEARWRPRDVLRVAAVTFALCVATLPVVGVDAYLDYARSLAAWAGSSAEWMGGNLGPGRYGLGEPALVLGLGVVLAALACADERRGVVLAFGASVLVQPVYGFYYAALLIPAAIDLWEVDRAATFWASLLAVPLAYVSPALAGIAFILAAIPRHRSSAPVADISRGPAQHDGASVRHDATWAAESPPAPPPSRHP